jgi:hypothetical protein
MEIVAVISHVLPFKACLFGMPPKSPYAFHIKKNNYFCGDYCKAFYKVADKLAYCF